MARTTLKQLAKRMDELEQSHRPNIIVEGAGTIVEARLGVMNTLGDAGIVYTPGGNYVLSIFINHQDQLIWDPASELVATMSEATYNYFNQVTR